MAGVGREVGAGAEAGEEQEQRVAAMFAYMQGLGASINYQPLPTMPWPPPTAPPPQLLGAPMVFPSAVTPVSMNIFACNHRLN